MDIWRAAQILNSRKWLILLSVVVTAGLTYAMTRLTGSKWQASVQLLVPQGSALTDLSNKGGDSATGLPQYGPYAKDASENQAATFQAIVKSKDVLDPALRQIHETVPPADLLARIEVKSTSA